jgi:hypothetical protein
METTKRQRLEASGWRVGTVEDFLDLSPVEAELIELKLALTQKLKEIRESLLGEDYLSRKRRLACPLDDQKI